MLVLNLKRLHIFIIAVFIQYLANIGSDRHSLKGRQRVE